MNWSLRKVWLRAVESTAITSALRYAAIVASPYAGGPRKPFLASLRFAWWQTLVDRAEDEIARQRAISEKYSVKAFEAQKAVYK